MKPLRVTIKIEFEQTQSGENATASYLEAHFDGPKLLNIAFNGVATLGQVLRTMCQNVENLVLPAMESAGRDPHGGSDV